jgi:LysR family transcriptional regulator of beta-lactamase
MFSHLLRSGRIQRPFPSEISFGSYWLTRLQSKAETSAMREFAQWLSAELVASAELHNNTEPQIVTTGAEQ